MSSGNVRAGAAQAPEQMVITRVFNAPRRLVFEAWTDCKHVEKWWGPRGFTTPFCRIDLRVGGMFHTCMRSPDGKDYWSGGRYQEIVAPERLVFTDFFSDEKGNVVPPSAYGMTPDWPTETLVTVTLTEEAGRTTVVVRSAVPLELAKSVGADQGWSQSLDKMEELLSSLR